MYLACVMHLPEDGCISGRNMSAVHGVCVCVCVYHRLSYTDVHLLVLISCLGCAERSQTKAALFDTPIFHPLYCHHKLQTSSPSIRHSASSVYTQGRINWDEKEGMLLPSLEWMRTSVLKLILVPLNKFLFFYMDEKLKFSHEDRLREQRTGLRGRQ
jgi:hypothetical protein